MKVTLAYFGVFFVVYSLFTFWARHLERYNISSNVRDTLLAIGGTVLVYACLEFYRYAVARVERYERREKLKKQLQQNYGLFLPKKKK